MLYTPFFVLLVFHGCRGGVPTFWYVFVAAGLIFLLNKLMTWFRIPDKVPIPQHAHHQVLSFALPLQLCASWLKPSKLISIAHRPGKVLHVQLEKTFSYEAGQYAQIIFPRFMMIDTHK